MRRVVAIWLYALAASGLLSYGAEAQVIHKDATCRQAVWDGSAKIGKATLKTITKCSMYRASGKLAAEIDCFDLGALPATLEEAMRQRVKTNCQAVPNQAALARYASCPSPAQASDDGEDTFGIDSFEELASCQTALNIAYVSSLARDVLSPNPVVPTPSEASSSIGRCAVQITKAAVFLWRLTTKLYGKCQVRSDLNEGPYEYGTSPDFESCRAEADWKIDYYVSKFAAKITQYCGGLAPADMKAVGSCSDSSAGITECVKSAVLQNAKGLTATGFEHAGQCPAELLLVSRRGNYGGGRVSETRIDAGWTGFAHDGDFFDGFATRLQLSCAAPDCESCAVSASCAEGNCRCSDDPSVVCDTPYVSGGACGAGTCLLHFGPPRPRSIGGVSVCLVETSESPINGVTDAGTGAMSLSWANTQRIYLGISQTQPCPTCSAAAIGEAGTCEGGTRNLLPCHTSALDPDFGPTSYDCPPTAGSHMSAPNGITFDLELTDGATSLASGVACDAPLETLPCTCGACSGDPTVACSSDQDCTNIGAGTCGAAGTVPRQPNSCADLLCTPLGPGSTLGTCLAGPVDHFCDGFTRANGEGYIACLTNADCHAIDPNAGACSQQRNRSCFLPTIGRSGSATPWGSVIGWVGCVPPVQTGSAVNSAVGLPGPARRNIAVQATQYCDDGVTPFTLGGSLCP